MENYPDKFWHCSVKLSNSTNYGVVNDLSFEDLERQIITPWLQSRPFTVAGVIVNQASQIEEIRVTHTPQPLQAYAQQHNTAKRASGIIDMATDRRMLPIWKGTDYTYDLLFQRRQEPALDADVMLVEKVCRRIANTARILLKRQRMNKSGYVIEDEYDVQDLLHAVLRAYLKYSVQEDPLRKVAGTHGSRADISIEDLGILIEVKYVHRPSDQKKIFGEFSQDLVLYSTWDPLQILLFVIYNSSDLRDPEALEKLSGVKEINGKRFEAKIILA